jgi:hypothetical protein
MSERSIICTTRRTVKKNPRVDRPRRIAAARSQLEAGNERHAMRVTHRNECERPLSLEVRLGRKSIFSRIGAKHRCRPIHKMARRKGLWNWRSRISAGSGMAVRVVLDCPDDPQTPSRLCVIAWPLARGHTAEFELQPERNGSRGILDREGAFRTRLWTPTLTPINALRRAEGLSFASPVSCDHAPHVGKNSGC